MDRLEVAYPVSSTLTRVQLIGNNSESSVEITNFKLYPNVDPVAANILPQSYYTVYVSGENDGETADKESVYTLPIIFNVDLFLGVDEYDVISLHGTVGPRGVKTISNDIQYFHTHKFLGWGSDEQSISGTPPTYGHADSQKDSQSGLNTFYHVTTVDPFILPPKTHLYLDVSATSADSVGLSAVSATFVADNPTYDNNVTTLYHDGQYTEGAYQHIELYNSGMGETSPYRMTETSPLINVSFDYQRSLRTRKSQFSRVRLSGSSYEASGTEVFTSANQFVDVCVNDSYPVMVPFPFDEYGEVPSGKGLLTISKLLIYAAEFNKSEKAVYDLYKRTSEGTLEPIAHRFPIYASSSDLPYNTMTSVFNGTSSLDLVEDTFALRGEAIRLRPRGLDGTNGEALVLICRENSLTPTGTQELVVYYEGLYEYEGAEYRNSRGSMYRFNHGSGQWEPSL